MVSEFRKPSVAMALGRLGDHGYRIVEITHFTYCVSMRLTSVTGRPVLISEGSTIEEAAKKALSFVESLPIPEEVR